MHFIPNRSMLDGFKVSTPFRWNGLWNCVFLPSDAIVCCFYNVCDRVLRVRNVLRTLKKDSWK